MIEITRKSAVDALEKNFSRENLILSFNEAVPDKIIPNEWKNFGIKNDSAAIAWYPTEWKTYGNRLPWIQALLRKCLIGTAVLYAKIPNLVYIFHDSEDYYLYIGKPPLNYLRHYPTSNLQNLPKDLIEFYQNIHNGFTFHPSNTMGPLSLENQPKLANLYDGNHPPFPKESIGIFHNGAGDYLSVAPGTSSHNAFIWWHEQPENPETNMDLWAVMDNWVSIFLEDTRILRN